MPLTPDQQQRLAMILGAEQQFPGRAPGGTGPTGLLSNDAQGWSSMLNDQTEGMNLQRADQGQGPLAVKAVQSSGIPSSDPSLGNSPAWWDSTGTGDVTSSLQPNKNVKWGGKGLPLSLQGLQTPGPGA